MSIKFKLLGMLMAVAAAAATGVMVLAAPVSHAASAECGNVCTDFYPQTTGVTDIISATGTTQGSAIHLATAADLLPEDFQLNAQGTVADFYNAGIIGAAVGTTWPSDLAYEIEYAPGGSGSGMCLGTAAAAAQDSVITLQPCGISADTIWVGLAIDKIGGYMPLIAGSDTIVNNPYVLTAGPVGSSLQTQKLGLVAGTFAPKQMWASKTGAI